MLSETHCSQYQPRVGAMSNFGQRLDVQGCFDQFSPGAFSPWTCAGYCTQGVTPKLWPCFFLKYTSHVTGYVLNQFPGGFRVDAGQRLGQCLLEIELCLALDLDTLGLR